ncbi:MAG: ABC transporter permease [Chloroflexi bacterium]|nr:ABC transporter permease [Chloroflexota bacterium]
MNLLFILRNLARRRMRTILTATGIAIGVAAIVALGTLAGGFALGYDAMYTRSGADLIALQKDAIDVSLSVVDEDIRSDLLATPGVKAAAGMLVGFVKTPQAPLLFLFGYEPGTFSLQHFKITEGVGLDEYQGRGRAVIVGTVAAKAMKLGVGDTLRITDSNFRIVGIYETGDPFEEGGAVISLRDAQALLSKPRQVGAFQIQLKSPQDEAAVRARIQRKYPGLTVVAAEEMGRATQTTQIIGAMGATLGALAILIGGVGVMNTALMSVFERTREIGMLRAIGWRRRRITLQVLGESIALSLVGALIGTALGISLVLLVGRIPGLTFLSSYFPPSIFAQAFTVSFLLGTVGGLYPAWYAARLEPIEAMRYEGGGARMRRSRIQAVVGWTHWPLSLRNVIRRRTRTILTALGIGISIMTLLTVKGISDSFSAQFTALATAGGTDLMAVQANMTDEGYSAIDERLGKKIAAMPEVKAVSGIIWWAASMPNAPLFMVFGYHPAEYGIQRFKIIRGQGLRATGEIIFGRQIADSLGIDVGDSVRIYERTFRVVGIFETGNAYEDGGGVISLRDAQTLFGKPRQVSLYSIKLRDPRQVETVLSRLKQEFPGLTFSKSAEFADSLSDMQQMHAMVTGLSILAVVVGGLGVMNTMLMSTFERTQEIGVLRAVGWSRRRIGGLIIQESVLLGLIGAVVGGLSTGVIGWLIGLIPALAGLLSIQINAGLVIQAIVVALFTGIVGGLYPAWWASRLQPVEALRYE